MAEPTRQDYLNLWLGAMMILLVCASFVASPYYQDVKGYLTPSLTGFMIKTLGSVTYTVGYNPKNYDRAYADEPVIFYISIMENSTDAVVKTASCSLSYLDEYSSTGKVNLSMPFDSLHGQYTATTSFMRAGNYTYSVDCTLPLELGSSIHEDGTAIVFEKLPDFNVSVKTPVQDTVENNTPVALTITNIGPLEYEGTIGVEVSYGDGESDAREMNLSSGEYHLSLSHNYSLPGNYSVAAIVDSDNHVPETDESNNMAFSSVKVVDESDIISVCGSLNKSVRLSANVYCAEGITISSPIKLDCNNYRIYGESQNTDATGLYIRDRATVANCQLSRYKRGIVAEMNLTLTNSTIYDTGTALVLKSDQNMISRNIFRNNQLGILNNGEHAITLNDFLDNVYDVNSSVAVNLSRNYFGTNSPETIAAGILNSTPYTLATILNGSARLDSSVDITPDYSGPSYTYIVNKSEYADKTILEITVNTSEQAVCGYSFNSSTFGRMTKLGHSNSMLIHKATLEFADEAHFKIYLICADESLNEGTAAVTSGIDIRVPVEIALSQMENYTSDLDSEEAALVSKKKGYEDQTVTETRHFKVAELELQINSTVIEINSIRTLKAYAAKAKSDLTKTKDALSDGYKKITDNNNKIFELTANLTLISDAVTRASRQGSLDMDSKINAMIDTISDLYDYRYVNETLHLERFRMLGEHLLRLDRFQLDELNIKKAKYEELQSLGLMDYSEYLTDLASQYDDLIDEYNQAVYDSRVAQYEYEIESLERKQDLYRAHLSEEQSLKTTIQAAIDFAKSVPDARLSNELALSLKRVQQRELDLADSIDQLNDDIGALGTELTACKRRGVLNEGILEPEFIQRFIITSDYENSGRIDYFVASSETLLSMVSIAVNGTFSGSSEVFIDKYRENPHNDSIGYKTIEWYRITATPGLGLASITLYYNVTDSRLESLGIMPEQPEIMFYNSTWTPIGTYYDMSDAGFIYSAEYKSLGQFAFGIANLSDANVTNGTNAGCVSSWQCGAFGECMENGTRERECVDKSNCSAANSTRIEAELCSSASSCSDAKKNGNEEGVDCGGSCSPCKETPAPPAQVEPVAPKRKRNILLDILVILCISGVIVFVAVKKLIPPGAKKAAAVKKASCDFSLIDMLGDRLFNYEDVEQVESQLVTKGRKKEEIDYYAQIVKFILARIEAQKKTGLVTNELIKNGWPPEESKEIVRYVTAKYIVFHMKDFKDMFQNDDEKKQVVTEMFTSEGFEEEIIGYALELDKKSDKK